MADYTFDTTKPAATDALNLGDDEIRSLKTVLKSALQDFTTFPTNPTSLKEGAARVSVGLDADKGTPSYEGQIYLATDAGKWFYANSVPAWVLGGYLQGTGARIHVIPCGAGIRFRDNTAYASASGQHASFTLMHVDAAYYQFAFDPRPYGANPTLNFITILAMETADAAYTFYSRLYNVTDAEVITNSEASHTGSTPGRYAQALTIGDAAGNVKKASKEYRVEIKTGTNLRGGAILGAWLEITEG